MSFFNYCLVLFGAGSADPGVVNEENELCPDETVDLPPPSEFDTNEATENTKEEKKDDITKNDEYQNTEEKLTVEEDQQVVGVVNDDGVKEEEINPRVEEKIETKEEEYFDLEAFMNKLQTEGITLTKHDRRGNSRERVFFTTDGQWLTWRSPGRPIVENKSKMFRIKDIIRIRDGSRETLSFCDKFKVDKELSLQIKFGARDFNLTCTTKEMKEELIQGLLLRQQMLKQ
mmetsp:Transcript_14887/g.19543  ORF Transcript_14887/g.19543 Transcript_14887/m.19543 type:complete len:230 (-) Transcript_14887:106-795(-)